MSDRGSFIDPEWLPDEADIGFAAALGLDVPAIERIAETFKDFWLAAAGQNARKRSWPATWRNWCRKEAEKLGKRNSPAASVATARRGAVVSGMASTFGGEDRGRTLFDLPDSAPRKH